MRGISLSVVAVTTLIAAGFSQQPSGPTAKPQTNESTVEDSLASAVKRNADILAAEAKVRQAEAELRRIKMTVMNDIVTTRMKLDAARNRVEIAEQELAYLSKARKQGVTSETEFRRSEAQLRQVKTEVAEIEAVMNTLTGMAAEKFQNFIGTVPAPGGAVGFSGHGVILGGGIGEGDGRPIRPPHPGMAEKIRKALDSPIKAADFTETPLKDVIDYYRQVSADVPFVASLGGSGDNPITLKLSKELPLGAHLQALQDVAPGLMISVRNYGFFLTFDTPPDDGMSYLDFWHGKSGTAEMRSK